MSLLDQLSGVLKQYTTQSSTSQPPAEVNEHFDQVAAAAPKDVVADGLAAAFRSNQTPAFGQMLGSLFNQSNGDQKAGILNQILASVGPGALATLGDGGLASLLHGSSQITPEQANQIPTDVIQQVATQAEKEDPSIIDRASQFYSAHPTLIKTLGGAALSIALAKVAQRQSNG